MKLRIILAALLAPAAGLAQPAQTPARAARNALVADLGLHVVGLGYQRTLSPAFSVQITANLYVPWMVNDNVLGLGPGDWRGPTELRGFGPRARVFWHPFHDAPSGLWVSPFTQFALVRATRPSGSSFGTAFAVGLSVGYAWQATRWLLISVGAGVQYHQATVEGSQNTPGFSLLAPTVDLNVAYTF